MGFFSGVRGHYFLRLLAALFLLGLGGEAAADSCYARDYSDAHMARNPDQIVRRMRLLLVDEPYRAALVAVVFRDDARQWSNSMNCFDPTGDGRPEAFMGCAVDCDGGAFYLRRTR